MQKNLILNNKSASMLVFAALLLGAFVMFKLSSPILPEYTQSKQLRYQFSVKNSSKETIDNAVFRVFVPVKQTTTQRVEDIRANFDFIVVADELGNQMLEFDFGQFSAFAKRVVRVEVDLLLAQNPVPEQRAENGEQAKQVYLQEEPYVELSDQLVSQVSKTVLKNTTDKTTLPRTAYNWLVKNIESTDYIPEDRGALWALQKKQGDCTEFMYAFIALLRANDIPARGVAGFVTNNKPVNILKSGGYHNWAQFLDEKETWRISDAQKKVFDDQYSQYVAFRVFSAEAKLTMNNSQRFLSFDKRLTVRMI